MPVILPHNLGLSPEKLQQQIKTTVELRTRLERRTDKDFSGVLSDNRSDLLQRIRVGASRKITSNVQVLLQYQYVGSLNWADSGNATGEHSDLYQATVSYKKGAERWTIGRQEINVGTQRLVGAGDWTEVGRTFDALRYGSGNVEAFAGKVGTAFPHPTDARFGGVVLRGSGFETGLYFKHDSVASGSVDHFTLSELSRKPIKGIDLELEGALQFGHIGDKKLGAWAFHAAAGRSVTPKDRVQLILDLASGGSGPNTVATFDNLYPTNHKFYGLMDMQAWKNMRAFALDFSHKAGKQHTLRTRYSRFYLNDSTDAWYGASGAANKSGAVVLQDATGKSGRDVGSEFDFEWNYEASSTWRCSAGIGVFSPGSFVRQIAKDDHEQVFGYFQVSMKF